MLINMLSLVAMTIAFSYMMLKAKFGRTRRLAMVPLACVAVELSVTGLLTPSLFPVLTAVLILLKGVILACCFSAMRADAAMFRRRARRLAARKAAAASELRINALVTSGCCA
ncbi:MAG: hypothetical protein PHR24_01595 [Oscillospiraceae bacterium]|nr:hypothetical protein [Oscillospiraceae bacterium]MDD3832781.1 hypothetical protein [Oscillospiraceae bacterium]MDD4545973.1 hypothetical protein [Oscillospiraceae bacterium]